MIGFNRDVNIYMMQERRAKFMVSCADFSCDDFRIDCNICLSK